MNYVPCHVHTVYSLLDGMIKIPALIQKVKDLGMSACAITDHNLLAGCPEFLENARNVGIKPILAVEGYYTEDRSEITSPIEDRRQVAIERALETGAITEQILADVRKGKTPKKTLQEMINPYMYDTKNYHIILMAQNQTGWKNLVMLQSEAARTGTFNGRFHVDMPLLRQYSEGIICTTACIGSYPAQMILKEDEDCVRQYLADMQEIFGDRFFLEVQPYNDIRQCEINDYYMRYGSAHGIKTVATNDSHWLNEDEYEDHCAMICIATGKKLSDPTRIHYQPEFWLRSYDEMVTAFEEQTVTGKDVISDPKEYRQYYLEALENTNTLAEMVTDDYVLGSKTPLFPIVIPENSETPESSLIKKAARGLKEYLRSHPDYNYELYKQRLIEELVVIISKGFAPYFLCVEEYINWCKDQDILTGPGRGSAASSLVSFCIGITKIIDPIKYKLIFSRFLTKDRKSAPDIDVDVMWAERGRVIQHLKDVYGADHVAHIGTFSTMGVKSGVKDVCRVLEINFTESNNLTAKIDEIDNSPGLTFSTIDSWKESDPEKWTKFNDLEISQPEVFRLARKFEGMPRQQGIHASGILITPKPVNQLTPIRYDKGIPVTLFTGVQVDEYNLIKLDVLGLKTLDQIQRTIQMIGMSIDDLYRVAKFEDPETWSMLQQEQTECVFQIESNLMKKLIKTVKPTEFEHLSALVAIGRPGPLGAGVDVAYAAGKNEGRMAPLPLRGTENIFGETWNCCLYQEQLMEISKQVAGFDDSQADSITRKILGKKIAKLMPMMFRCHAYGKRNIEGPPGWETNDTLPWYDPKGKYGSEIPGAIANGYTADEIRRYFDLISEFASYSFNRSHSACYGYLAWLTAWLKRHYTAQFMSNTISMADAEDKGKYMNTCRSQFGIKFIPPDINISEADFTPYDQHTIYYGLGAIKGVGITAVNEILRVRQTGVFSSLADFLVRVNRRVVNAKVVVALIKAGCFDYFCENRYKLVQDYYIMMNPKEKDFAKVADKITDPEKWSDDERNNIETELLGTRVTHPSWIDCLATGKKLPENTSLERTLIPKKNRDGSKQYQNGQVKYMPYALTEVVSIDRAGQYYQRLRLKTDGLEYIALDSLGYWTGDHTYFPDPVAHSGIVVVGDKVWVRGIKQENGTIKITSMRAYKEGVEDDKPEDG